MRLLKTKYTILAIIIVALLLLGLLIYVSKHNLRGWFADPTADAKQMILVTADNWNATTGVLQRFARDKVTESWKSVGDKINVNLGKNGMGWGIGLHGATLTFAPRIIEGAKKTPAGVFAIDLAFGQKSAKQSKQLGVKLPYQQITDSVFCPDDISSKFYNKLVDAKIVTKDWHSAENMYDYMKQGLYVYGFVVNHNYVKPISGRGSCFFVHIYRGVGVPTAGCTAFKRDLVKSVVIWLDPAKKPVLVQLPKNAYILFKDRWNLPKE